MATIVVIQARIGSNRLPGKTLMPLNGKSLLKRVIDNVRSLNFVDQIVVATTTLEEDNLIDFFCQEKKINVFRGDNHNLLKRFVDATILFDENDNIIRITADNPILDIEISSKLYNLHVKNNNDYTCINGLSHIVFEVIKISALRQCFNSRLITDYDKEHVTPFFRNEFNNFKTQILPSNYSGLNPDFDQFLTVDTYPDFVRMQNLFLEIDNKIYNLNNIYNWIKKKFYD